MTEQTADAGSTNTDTGAETSQVNEGGTDVVVDPGQSTESSIEPTASVSEQPVIPDAYSFDTPDGGQIDDALITAVSPVMKEIGITQEQAGKLFSAYSEAISQGSEDTINQAQVGWEQSLKDDPDFGGDNFEANAGQVAQFIQATVPDDQKEELVGALRDTGMGSHPALVKYIHSLSKMFPTGEDSPTGGNPINGSSKTTAQRMYGTD